MKVITLVSSGFDSISLMHYYLEKDYEVYPIYVKCGFKWEDTELNHLYNIIDYLKSKYQNIKSLKVSRTYNDFSETFNKSNFIEDEDVKIPFRNLELLIEGLKYAYTVGSNLISLGIMGLVSFEDNNEVFLKAINNVFSMYGNYKVEAPFLGMSKKDVFDKYFISELFETAFCCMNPIDGKECGVCSKCREKELLK